MDRLTEWDIFGKKEPLYQMSHGCLNPGGFWLRCTLCILVFPPLWSTARQCRWISFISPLVGFKMLFCWVLTSSSDVFPSDYIVSEDLTRLYMHIYLDFVYHNVGHCGPPPAFERHVWGRAEFASLIHISYRFTSLNKNGIFQAKTRATLNWAGVNAS